MEQICRDIIEAVKEGDIICAVRLLGEGRSPNVRDESGRTPLHYAIRHGYHMVRVC